MKFKIQNSEFRIVELVIHLTIIILLVLWTARPIAAQTVTPAVMTEKSGTEAAKMEATEGASASGETTKKKSDYQLPYPGLLPDHPLYVLKTIRDRIVDFLITDSLKEAEFTLLAADKRLAAAAALVDKDKPELAESTASKGMGYLARSIKLIEKAKSEGKERTAFLANLKRALPKHEEVLTELAAKTEGSVKDRFTAMKEEATKYSKTLKNE